MTFTIAFFAKYLGKPASSVLAAAPFLDWSHERAVETDLDEVIIDYVFADDGVDLQSDKHDHVRAIFLYFDAGRRFHEGLADIPDDVTRGQLRAMLGEPSKSGGPLSDPVLGEYGPWDRFSRGTYTLHIQYRAKEDRINAVTLMRSDVAPA